MKKASGTASSVLARMTPTRTVLCCCVGKNEKVFGLAVSDPYLSHARPLLDVRSRSDVDKAIVEHNAGAIFFAGHRHNSTWSIPSCAIPSVTREEALLAKEDEAEMWESVDISDESLSTDAAMALNLCLWDYGQGWRNTFG